MFETSRVFHIGQMFQDAAVRYGHVTVTLDQPLELAPELGVDLTVGQLAELVDELAARLAAAGVRAGDKIAIYKTDNFDIAVLACAAARIGAVPAMLSPALDPQVVAALLARLDRPWLLTDPAKLDTTALDTDTVRGVLFSTGAQDGSLDRFAGAPRQRPVRTGPLEPALITHSSGTTGLPKLAVHCARAMWFRLLPQKLVALPIRRVETVAFCMTFVHSRFYHALGVFLAYGNPLVVAVSPDPATIGPLFTRTRPGLLETQPNTFIEWEYMDTAPGRPLSSVRYYSATFDAMHPRTIRRLLDASDRRDPMFFQFYGQSETGPVSCQWYTRASAENADGRCVGLPLPGFVRVRITDTDGRPVPRGRIGYIEVRNRSRALTYHGEDDRWLAQFNDGWWRMGDMGKLDGRGRLHLMDREVDQIDDVDSNLEIEDILMSRLADLREVVIIPGTDNRPTPVICTRDEAPLDTAAWDAAVRDLGNLADPIHLPFHEVPRTSTWKVRRPELIRKLRGA
ncbi:class I adenylate-forming enzyme family protein [Actinokineospora diospyrosa]|uniref:Long-chain acyl-CoA synthetase n=1 Tax=Actinokineospora diospyrosa TaxID=103728 RepID=A0ABT1ILF6_9PSEU|nr:class I adenylate-forming enzyme family protein [Actinokineospora diospyrosa]MCP2273492.1 long-chain acyl-CoA synthetase [Actinokineospora diospyrosa]